MGHESMNIGLSFEAIAPQVTAARIAAFERKHRLVLPADYRAFLLKHNGGYPQPHDFVGDDGVRYYVRVFYGLDASEPAMDIEDNIRFFRPVFDGRFIAVGDDASGRTFLLDPGDSGLFAWTGSLPGPDLPASLSQIAHTFSSFLANVQYAFCDVIEHMAECGDLRDLEEYVNTGGSLLVRTTKLNLTLLEAAARAGNLPMVTALLKKDVPLGDAAHLAVSNEETIALREIVSRRTLTGRERDRYGRTLLDVAAESANPDVLAILEGCGLGP